MTDANDLTSRETVASLLRSTGVRPSKRLGQNFLVDRGVLDSIVAEVKRAAPEELIEIGAGLGTMTRQLAGISRHVVAIEVDARLIGILEQSLAPLGNVELRHEDVLEFDLACALGGRTAFVVGNIPYRITAPILNWLVDHRRSISGALLLTQTEVADKIASSPGPDGSSLGVRVRAYGDAILLRKVSRSSFYPVPDVGSTLWRLRFRGEPRFSAFEGSFFAVVRTLYGKRRKMIRAALRDLLAPSEVGAVLEEAGIDPTVRGETLSFEALDRLARAIAPLLQAK